MMNQPFSSLSLSESTTSEEPHLIVLESTATSILLIALLKQFIRGTFEDQIKRHSTVG